MSKNEDYEGNEVKDGDILYVAVSRGDSVAMEKGLMINKNTNRVLYIINKTGFWWATAANLGDLGKSVKVDHLEKCVSCDDADWFKKKSDSTIELTNFNSDVIEWIRSNVQDEWTITKSAKEIAFKNPKDAVLFKLMMSGENC